MKRIELYVDNNNRLNLIEYKNYDSKQESKILKGTQTYDYIKKLATSKIVDICEYQRKKDLLLEYKNYVINIISYDKVFSKRGLYPLAMNIKEYEENQALKKNKKRKVKRKNKYTSRRIIANGLALIMMGTWVYNLLEKENKLPDFSDVKTKITQLVDSAFFSSTLEIEDNSDKKETDILVTEEENLINISIDFEDRSSTEKAYITKAYYGDIISKYAKMYGLDPNLVIAVATQESGIHSEQTNKGGATGLMQIQNKVWIGENVTAYNFETNTKETVDVTLEKIQDEESNIKIGCMILQNALEYMNYNTLAGIQCYNMGYGNMNKVLNEYSKNCNKSVEEILSDVEDTNWLEYRSIINQGDQEYLEHVLSWAGEEINFKNVKKDGSLINIKIDNNMNSKKVY